MSPKNDRLTKIKSFLRFQTSPCSVSEIHEALYGSYHLNVSRKTIERDMLALADHRIVTIHEGVPARYSLNKPQQLEVVLEMEEIREILRFLDPNSRLFVKMYNFLAKN